MFINNKTAVEKLKIKRRLSGGHKNRSLDINENKETVIVKEEIKFVISRGEIKKRRCLRIKTNVKEEMKNSRLC